MLYFLLFERAYLKFERASCDRTYKACDTKSLSHKVLIHNSLQKVVLVS